MSRIIANNIRHNDATADSLSFDSSGNVSVPNDLVVDTDTLFVDASTDRVGIGTTSPNEVFDSRGAAVFSGDHATSQNAYGTAHGILLSSTNNIASIKAVSNGSNDVAIRFVPLSSGSGSEAMRILPGGGLTFNGDTATANALDDYEEGTWTPVVKIGGTTISSSGYSFTGANYVKIGSMVYVALTITSIEKGSNTGTITFEGLPFTIASGNNRADYSGVMRWQGIGTSSATIVPYFVAGQSKIELQKFNGSNGYYGNVNDADLASSFDAYFIGGWYTVA